LELPRQHCRGKNVISSITLNKKDCLLIQKKKKKKKKEKRKKEREKKKKGKKPE
jgi:hypothetical protein